MQYTNSIVLLFWEMYAKFPKLSTFNAFTYSDSVMLKVKKPLLGSSYTSIILLLVDWYSKAKLYFPIDIWEMAPALTGRKETVSISLVKDPTFY